MDFVLKEHQLLKGPGDWESWKLAMKSASYAASVYGIMKPVFSPTFDSIRVASHDWIPTGTWITWDDRSERMRRINLALTMILASASTATIFLPGSRYGVIDDPIRLWARLQETVAPRSGPVDASPRIMDVPHGSG